MTTKEKALPGPWKKCVVEDYAWMHGDLFVIADQFGVTLTAGSELLEQFLSAVGGRKQLRRLADHRRTFDAEFRVVDHSSSTVDCLELRAASTA